MAGYSEVAPKLQDILQQFNYSVMNDKNQPKRVTSDTQTLIDLVITSMPEIIKGTIKTTELGISDHKLRPCYNMV